MPFERNDPAAGAGRSSRARPESERPETGWCNFCQRAGVAAYRPPALPFLPGATGRWHCRRCGASGPAVDARKPLAEWEAFELAMRVEPRRVHDARGRFKRVEPVGGRDTPREPAVSHTPEANGP